MIKEQTCPLIDDPLLTSHLTHRLALAAALSGWR